MMNCCCQSEWDIAEESDGGIWLGFLFFSVINFSVVAKEAHLLPICNEFLNFSDASHSIIFYLFIVEHATLSILLF